MPRCFNFASRVNRFSLSLTERELVGSSMTMIFALVPSAAAIWMSCFLAGGKPAGWGRPHPFASRSRRSIARACSRMRPRSSQPMRRRGKSPRQSIFRDGKIRAEGKFLMHHGDAQLPRGKRRGRVDGLAIDEDFAVVSGVNARENFAERALARAVFANERVARAAFNFKADTVQGMNAGEAFRNVFECEIGHARCGLRGCASGIMWESEPAGAIRGKTVHAGFGEACGLSLGYPRSKHTMQVLPANRSFFMSNT